MSLDWHRRCGLRECVFRDASKLWASGPESIAGQKLEGETVVNKIKILIVPIAVLAAVTCSLASDARADDQQEISDLEHKVAIVTNGDEVMKYWDGGDDIVLFDMMGPPREYAGHKAIHDHADEFSGWTNLKVNFVELKVISDGNLALARSVQHATATTVDGKPFEVTFRATDVWRKRDGQWKLISVHVSVPVDLKTGKADMASKM
jgi:ketosteroid isomerase-like protein